MIANGVQWLPGILHRIAGFLKRDWQRLREKRQRQWADRASRCTRCGYSLKGIESQHCPECGTSLAVRRHFATDGRFNLWVLVAFGSLGGAVLAFGVFATARGVMARPSQFDRPILMTAFVLALVWMGWFPIVGMWRTTRPLHVFIRVNLLYVTTIAATIIAGRYAYQLLAPP